MTLPVVAYGHPVLRKVATPIDKDYPELQKLITDMQETMYHTNGVGLAAPQINRPIRLFVIDTVQIVENFDDEDKLDYPNEQPVKRVFINAEKVEDSGEPWSYNEGCLSIPKVREDIRRPSHITLKYLDENFEEHTETFTGITGRVIQHEYDHIEGRLFIDYVAPLKKRLIKKRLDDIAAGKIKTDYRMIFAR